ncbi:hypothetical protein GCM10023219_09630 [Stakelama sediminis]|uniref:Uncharacterized protein n=1 Tax=Stakelama sediminis TaxID=463200 RepID=A0A840YVV8_9SPHN|nr:hypothetical protein [Stakelama sediminis]MBB5717686.1 hypothetical protein [Stakelama sediminis]
MPRPSPWTDALTARFCEALRVQGEVRAAARAVGVTAASAYRRRARDPGFAARWDAALAEAKAARCAGRSADAAAARRLLPQYRMRHDGWTAARQKLFLRALSETGCVRDACKRARISSTSAYRIRKSSPAFARAWTRALAKAQPTIEQAAYDRAVTGWDEPIVSGGKVVAQRRRYSDSLLRLLLLREEAGDAGAGADAAPAPAGEAQGAALRVPDFTTGMWGDLIAPDGSVADPRSPVAQAWLAAQAVRQGNAGDCDGSGWWAWDTRQDCVVYESQIEAKREVLRRLDRLAAGEARAGGADAAASDPPPG